MTKNLNAKLQQGKYFFLHEKLKALIKIAICTHSLDYSGHILMKKNKNKLVSHPVEQLINKL